MRDINLKATECFEAVARLSSVTKAAEELGVSPSAVSQQLRNLETQFGVSLFRREKKRLVLTLDGDRLFQTTTQAFSALRNVCNVVSRQRNTRSLAIRVSPSFGVRWLGPRIAGFSSDNPEWTIRIDATPDFSAFDTEAVDLDLRYGLGGWAGLSVNCVMNDFVMPMCSPEYLERLRSISEDPSVQLAHAKLIDSVKTLYRWDLWLASNRIDLPELSYPFRFDRSSMSIETAKQGAGIALDSVTLCLPDLERGDLVPFNPGYGVIDFPAYWFVCPPRHFNRRIVKRFSEWLTSACGDHQVRARNLLKAKHCTFRTSSGPDTMGISPWPD
ncbi:LysR family transcriptional regulator [Aurantimonas sp. C2-6-R+9]|uniref:LysR family transcriptional regulator n=1 Tax=unclassified Aurantimonas TaxID=2638230 RepID=UPI002E199A05|nr:MULTISPECIES: LysR family transcriptional regulator [unclassified Aurantimonas]MEC5292423.1 LysR family transcriptional regulator [Aurantimonas sp. C2-3-R2]MEC5383875.1 LysR family transcriptional regulator [Aurantimonas sp. C2-6-R+9]MEC5413495.1 LysR family transcriptional regulator [Aurantimonas sp. C2-4-R8]